MSGYLPERPEYKWLEKQINEQHPSARWARNPDEVDKKGLRLSCAEARARSECD